MEDNNDETEFSSQKSPTSDAKTRKSYSNSTKLEAVDFAEKNSKEAAARKYKVAAKTIRDWCSKKSTLMSAPSKRRRLDGKILYLLMLQFLKSVTCLTVGI
jgi:GTP cyclohydrolase II